jgi:hypothetical protein
MIGNWPKAHALKKEIIKGSSSSYSRLIYTRRHFIPIYHEDVGQLDTSPHIQCVVACVLQALLVKYVTLCQRATAAERRFKIFKKTSLVPEMPSWESRNRENGINKSLWQDLFFV